MKIEQIAHRIPKSEITVLAKSINSEPAKIQLLIDAVASPLKTVQFNAIWILRSVYEANPNLLKKDIPLLVGLLKKHPEDVVQRNILAMLQHQKQLPKVVWDDLANICFNALEQNSTPTAIRVFAMDTAFQLLKYFPELVNELIVLVEDHLPVATTGFKNRAGKLLPKLYNIKAK
ncbi:hypothetical protein [Persicobacter psychrovividus]|uniref:HEAT repeat domain-containing protein n=1 Tax=Persicobacter psychrovividus TaxID=387638 RepID=A0ABM7VBZ6_9BACT|nr:hypothetical protein PEPS_07070 [Persicobacter psychrovividus]